jgi:hypothetical protein
MGTWCRGGPDRATVGGSLSSISTEGCQNWVAKWVSAGVSLLATPEKTQEFGVPRYKTWRSRNDNSLHVFCAAGSEAFEALPAAVRDLGPWIGGPEGELERLRLPYRVLLSEQGFVLLYCHVSELQLEAANARALHAANAECPQCKASGRVPMHHGLKDKECPRCGGRGWVRAPSGR